MRLIGTHMNPGEIAELDAIAQEHRVSRSAVIRWAILEYLRAFNALPTVKDRSIHSPHHSNHYSDPPTER
jgi:metal-responsive CopG/Arc/MetJ family transcriptional regulator